MPDVATDEPEVLAAIVEESLLFGHGARGTAVQLRTLDDWKRTWSQWRSIVLPKSLLLFPGRRPFACYVTRELPATALASGITTTLSRGRRTRLPTYGARA